MSNLVEHARYELERLGQTAEDPAYAASIVAAIAALASYGHSGGSMSMAIWQIHDLLQFRPLSPLTNDREEWLHHSSEMSGGVELWQSKRDGAAFSNDGGKTYYYVDDRSDTGTHTAQQAASQ